MKSRDKLTEMIKRIDKVQDKGVKYEVNFGNLYVDNEELAEYLLKYYQPKKKGETTMSNQIAIDGLPPKDKTTNENNNLKRRWENGFQRWSNKQSQDGSTPLGKCGYSDICDYCTDNCYGRPCVRALNELCRDRKITIDYNNKNYQDIWEI